MPARSHRLVTFWLVLRLTGQEAFRRRAAVGLAAISALLLLVFALASAEAMDAARRSPGSATADVVGATLLGTAAFTDLLLGAIVAVFLAHGAFLGDAERGLLQPLLVRPVSRWVVLLARTLGAAGVAAAYIALMWVIAVVLLRVAGDWSPDAWIAPGLAVTGGVALVAVLAVAISTVLPAITTGIVSLMLVGLGFTVGMLAQLGNALGIASLRTVADVVSMALPFEALYRHALHVLSAGLGDLAGLGIAVGPFGGAREAPGWIVAWVVAWTAGVLTLALFRARRADL